MCKGTKIFEFDFPLHNGKRLLGTLRITGNYQDNISWEVGDMTGVSLCALHQYCDEVGAENINGAITAHIEYLESLNRKTA